MSKIKLMLFKLIAITIAFIAVIILTEVILRLAKPFTSIYCPAGKAFEAIYIPDDDYVYGLKPNTIYKHYSYYGDFIATYRINSEGLRAGRDYGHAKPSGIKRILMLGDSYAFGRGVDNDQTCAAGLENMLNMTKKKYEVLNAGILGYSTDNEYLYLRKKGLLFGPDIVILMMFPRNDIMDMVYHDWMIDKAGFPTKIVDRYYAVDATNHLVNILRNGGQLRPSRLKEFIRNNSYLYTFLSEYRYWFKYKWLAFKHHIEGMGRKEEKQVIEKEVFDIEKAKPEERKMLERACLLLEGMNETAGASGARFVLVLIPDSPYDDFIANFAKSKNINLIDIRYDSKKDIPNLYLPKDMHWSRFGNAYVARLIYERILEEDGK